MTDVEYILETRPCKDCGQFIPKPYDIPICKKMLMGVTSDMLVSYRKDKGTCFEEKSELRAENDRC
jgi:hypothetical protein